MSMFADVDLCPPDLIFGIRDELIADTDPRKVSLLIGAYRTEEGKPLVLPVVRTVEKQISNDETLNHEYLPIEGMPSFCSAASKLALGPDSKALVENRVAYVQTLSGTGAVRLALQFLNKFHAGKSVYVPKPTWGNHKKIAIHAGFNDIKEYAYFDPNTKSLDINGAIRDLEAAVEGSIVIFHGCAQNPCGVDPSEDDWKAFGQVVVRRKLICVMDFAYQGFVSGDPDVDAFSLRHFESLGVELFFCQSFAKIFGLYNERIGNLGVVCNDSTLAMNVKSHLKAFIRPMYSNPPAHGARIVATILNNKALDSEWREQLKSMADRILRARQLLNSKLKEAEVPGDWSHILSQKGMFTFTGLTAKQVAVLKEKHHMYMLPNGRINMCAVTEGNVDYVVQAFKDVVVNVV
ncbi:aspartate aminotransferase, cytoplasmic-like [Clytia hemisphaerica]|uniref:Aspartate aminotransferase n=1 Tax=Clytia hemisphaerica TaxID=252671 RepID=A0A7M5TXD6_9CNID|eukprot:TCONS_00030748-protein